MHAHRFRVLTALAGALALSLVFSCTKASGGDPSVITHTAPLGEQPEGVPVQISVGVTDTDGVQTVALYYQAPHAGTWNSVILTQGASANTYTGEIPGTAVVAPSVSYYFEATDAGGDKTTLPADAPATWFSVTVGGGNGADTKGPTISHVPVVNGRTMGSEVMVSATVTDATGVGTVTCYYRAQGNTDWSSMVMTSQGNDKYAATFPITVIVPEAVEYYLEAVDTAPGQNRSTLPMTAPDDIYTFTVSHGDETPPIITHTPIANGQPEGRPAAVVARIEDLSIPLARAEVMYRTHGTTTWTTLTMTQASGSNTWSAIIPADAATTAGVDYRIEAEDGAPLGNVGYAPGPSADEFYTFTTAPETCVVPPLASESFEAGIFPGWWRTSNANVDCEWTVDDSYAHDGAYSAYHPGYGDDCDDRLILPCLDLTGITDGLVIDFWQWQSSVSGDDIHTLEWAENNPAGTYTAVGAALPYESSSYSWGYRKVTIPPGAPMLGKSKVYLSFRYQGDYATGWDYGWALDEIRVRQPGPAIELSHITASPNPVVSPTADVTLNVTLRNTGDGPSSALTGTLSTTDTGITISTATAAFPGVPAGGETTSATPFHLAIAAGHANGEAPLKLTATDGTHTYNIDIKLYIGPRAQAHIVLVTSSSTWESDTELYLGYGATPETPTWISSQIPYVASDPDTTGTFTYDVDLSAQVAHLPPTMAEPWFLKAVHKYSGTMNITAFSISYGATSYSALGLPWNVPGGSSSTPKIGYLLLPEPPRFVVDALVTTPTTLAPNTPNATLAITVRNLGSATQGTLTGVLTLKAPTTTADVTGLTPTTGVQFAAGPVGNNSTATGASTWSFGVTSAHNDGSPLNFNLHLTDATSGLTWDVPVKVDVPWPGISVVEWGGATATWDSDGVPDPPATGEGAYGLILVVENTGSLATAGPVHATLAINAASTGKATIASTQMTFGNAALAAGARITSTNSVDLTLTSSAAVHDTIKVDATFTDGTNTWVRTINIPVYAHAGDDPKDSTYGSTGTHDLRFQLFHCDNTTLDVRLIGWANESAESKATSLIIAHPNTGAVLRLATSSGTISAYKLNAAGTGWESTTTPPSLTITPATGSTAYLTFRVSLADIASYIDGSTKRVRLGAQEDSYSSAYDYLPNAWSNMSPSSLSLVSW